MADQLVHLLRHVASQGGDSVPFVYGHVANYDSALHRARVIIPSMTDQDGTPLLSPWMPVSTMASGAGFGVQYILRGGATVENPTNGEQVVVGVFSRQRGVAAVLASFYHGTNRPPATDLPSTQDGFNTTADAVTAGDLIISAPHATEGGANTFIRLRQNGQIQIWSAGQVQMDVIGGVTATVNTGDVNVSVTQGNATLTVATGDATVEAKGTVNIIGGAIRLGSAVGDVLKTLCTSAFQLVYNVHTHDGGGPPTPTATAATMTSIVTAE